jgi:hypothetical protein
VHFPRPSTGERGVAGARADMPDTLPSSTQVEYQPRSSAHLHRVQRTSQGRAPFDWPAGNELTAGSALRRIGIPRCFFPGDAFPPASSRPQNTILDSPRCAHPSLQFLRWRSSSQRASIPTSYMRDAARTAYGEGLSEVGLNDIWLFPSVFDLWQQ